MPNLFADLALPDEAATAALAARLAAVVRPGDVLLLSGPIGAGKTALARALIRHASGNPAEDVPSPTFTLVQTYATPRGEIWHADLYRLSHPDEVLELGLAEAFDTAICLVEWPDRLGSLTPPGALRIELAAGRDGHRATLTAPPDWHPRLESALA
jgi:tRNA threonylcarbamoyladenosine biosynthesis protein TsaE